MGNAMCCSNPEDTTPGAKDTKPDGKVTSKGTENKDTGCAGDKSTTDKKTADTGADCKDKHAH